MHFHATLLICRIFKAHLRQISIANYQFFNSLNQSSSDNNISLALKAYLSVLSVPL